MHFVINIMHFNSNMSTQGALYANQSSSAYTHTRAHSIMLCEHVSIIAAVRLTQLITIRQNDIIYHYLR